MYVFKSYIALFAPKNIKIAPEIEPFIESNPNDLKTLLRPALNFLFSNLSQEKKR